MSPIVPTIILALLIVGIVLLIKSRIPELQVESPAPTEEPFTNKNVIPNVAFCPLNSTATILQSGETHCCVGKASKKFGCLEKTVCTLSASPDGKIPSCGAIMKKHYDEQAKKHCYPGMPNYYENTDEQGNVTERGCYAGPTNISMSGPVSKQQPTCVVDYSDISKIMSNPKSCYNIKRLQSKQCPRGIKCNKSFVETGKGNPLLLQVSWMGKRQVFGKEINAPVTTYTIQSVIQLWNKVWPEWSKAYNWGNLSAAQLSDFFYEVRRDLLEGRSAPQQTNVFWNYVDYWSSRGDKNIH